MSGYLRWNGNIQAMRECDDAYRKMIKATKAKRRRRSKSKQNRER